MKLKVTGLKKEMSTTGTGASFAAGTGGQIATPKAFKIRKSRKDEIGEPFDIPNPSVPNRKSKFIDYKQLFEDAIEELSEKKQFNPVTDLTNSQSGAGLNTGYDMDTQSSAYTNEAEIGDQKSDKGIEYTVTDVDPVTGAITWDVEYVPAFDSVYTEFNRLRKAIAELDVKTKDTVIDDIAAKIKVEFNRYRTHIRKNYPDSYKKFRTNEEAELNEARYSSFKKKSQFKTPTQQLHTAVREIRRKIDEITKVVTFTERMRTELKASHEGMSYLNRTREAISKINEKLQDLNNRIKGLTE